MIGRATSLRFMSAWSLEIESETECSPKVFCSLGIYCCSMNIQQQSVRYIRFLHL